MEAQALLACTNCPASGAMAFFSGSGTYLGQANSPVVQPRSGQYKTQLSEWAPVSWQGLAPAGTARMDLYLQSASGAVVNDPALHWAEVAVYVANPAGTTPCFSGHYVALNANIASLEAVAFARFITISITSARSYLDIGRLWVGPAYVPKLRPDRRAASDQGCRRGAARAALRQSLLPVPARRCATCNSPWA